MLRSDARRVSAAGFTLVELSISLLVTVVVLLGVLALFDFGSRLSRVQTHVAEMQQSLRAAQSDMVRTVRMAGRGGLPVGDLPAGLAVAVRNQVPAGAHIGGPGTPEILEGTDVLTVRGVFSSLSQINAARPEAFTLTVDAGGPVAGAVLVRTTTPTSIPQDLGRLREAVRADIPEALLLVGADDASVYAVVELDPRNSDVDSDPDQIRIAFRITGGTHTAGYLALSRGGAFPAADLTTVAFVGILEEHRFYIRPEFAGADLVSRLSRARVFPGTEAPHRDNRTDVGVADDEHPSWRLDVADGIVDLQVALGLDTPRGGGAMSDDEEGTGDDDRIFESADGRDDDWLYNDGEPFDPTAWNGRPLYYIRVTTLARTGRRDPHYQAPLLVELEDHDLAASRLNRRTERMYRRRTLETVIDMRNLG